MRPLKKEKHVRCDILNVVSTHAFVEQPIFICMSLPTLVSYTPFKNFEHELPVLSRETTDIRTHIRQTILETYAGDPVLFLIEPQQSHWFLLLALEEVRRVCPEIALQLSEHQLLLLLSQLDPTTYTHAENVLMLPEILFKPDTEPESRTEEITFNMAQVPSFSNDNLLDLILFIKQRVSFTKKVILTGTPGHPLVVFLCYTIWLNYAQSLVYQEREHQFILM